VHSLLLCSGILSGFSDTPQQDESGNIKFGSFSLGDVMIREIQKFSRFAFRGKHILLENPPKNLLWNSSRARPNLDALILKWMDEGPRW
jgi:hypothetical protein